MTILLQEQLDNGIITLEQARNAENRNLVTRALGVDPEVDVEVNDYDVRAGDIILLCSDGLNDMVEDDEIELTLNTLGEICRWQQSILYRCPTTTAAGTMCRSFWSRCRVISRRPRLGGSGFWPD